MPIDHILPLTDARDKFSKVVSDVVDSEEMFILTRGGKPAIALINIGYLERLIGTQTGASSAEHTSSPKPAAFEKPAPRSDTPFPSAGSVKPKVEEGSSALDRPPMPVKPPFVFSSNRPASNSPAPFDRPPFDRPISFAPTPSSPINQPAPFSPKPAPSFAPPKPVFTVSNPTPPPPAPIINPPFSTPPKPVIDPTWTGESESSSNLPQAPINGSPAAPPIKPPSFGSNPSYGSSVAPTAPASDLGKLAPVNSPSVVPQPVASTAPTKPANPWPLPPSRPAAAPFSPPAPPAPAVPPVSSAPVFSPTAPKPVEPPAAPRPEVPLPPPPQVNTAPVFGVASVQPATAPAPAAKPAVDASSDKIPFTEQPKTIPDADERKGLEKENEEEKPFEKKEELPVNKDKPVDSAGSATTPPTAVQDLEI